MCRFTAFIDYELFCLLKIFKQVFRQTQVLKKLLKKPTDGLAVDIIQKEQYSKSSYNIMDNNLRNKGVMTKPVNIDKILAKNLVKPDPKGKKNQK